MVINKNNSKGTKKTGLNNFQPVHIRINLKELLVDSKLVTIPYKVKEVKDVFLNGILLLRDVDYLLRDKELYCLSLQNRDIITLHVSVSFKYKII